MPLADVHCHLDLFNNEEIKEVIRRAQDAQLKAIITNGINPESNRKTLDLAKRFPLVRPALGLYPTDAIKLRGEEIEDELEFIQKNKDAIAAIGEVGLDNTAKDNGLLKRQGEILEKLIALSEKMRKPLILHTRKAEQEAIDMLESASVKNPLLHCFCGKLKLVRRAADNGYHFSIPAAVVRMEHFQKVVEMLPLPQLHAETDSPYLSPYKEQKNEPSFIIESVRKIAEIKSMTIEDTAGNLFMNYQKIFT